MSPSLDQASPPPPPPPIDDDLRAEIRDAFDVFDEERTGRISPQSLKILSRALGLKVTRDEIFRDVDRIHRDRGGRATGEMIDGVDLAMACEIVAEKLAGRRRDSKSEMRRTFRLFTDGDRITEEDLRRVARDVGGDANSMGSEQFRAMIDEFDRDLDGAISFEEFCRIMEPMRH